ncbi:MAG: transcriptional repressor [Chloroflexi bacterium]|nr:transcriptional repressor [Chloroflexota bacterium]
MTTTPFAAGLRQNHRKLTRSRQAVLDIITQASHHLTPADIYRQAKTRYPNLGLTTVYRTLDLLVELGYIQRIHLEEGCHSYAPTARPHGHHLVCSVCGRAEEFADCDLDALVRSLQARTGYEIQVHVLELMGRCPSCQNKTRALRARRK